MSHQKLVKGLEVDSPHAYDHVCSGYILRKLYKLPLLDSSLSVYSKMELVFMNLTSLILVSTWEGSFYALIIVEVSCHYLVG